MIVYSLLIVSFCQLLLCDVFTSVEHIQLLSNMEKQIPTAINAYIRAERERLTRLRRWALDNAEETSWPSDKSVHNPISAFLLIKRWVFMWSSLERLMMTNSAHKILKRYSLGRHSDGHRQPDEDDLHGAAVGLLRLQDTYQLQTEEIANGHIRGTSPTQPMKAGDCFEIGRAAYSIFDYYHTILWMEEAQRRVLNEAHPSANLAEILEFLAFAHYKQGNVKLALKLTDELYALGWFIVDYIFYTIRTHNATSSWNYATYILTHTHAHRQSE
ncbi:hypothetical protein AB6A40_011327 [Gnathostoma spinigerum]|uniref:Prolyl 4-hydroxylase alpha-subunit N-terminal domain-containing protein n=1 Tax=Gnathostoma spinigerum TaxID=75299 RepID=A0ABD6EXX6_9BILA